MVSQLKFKNPTFYKDFTVIKFAPNIDTHIKVIGLWFMKYPPRTPPQYHLQASLKG